MEAVLKDFFLIKKDKIVPFSAKVEDGNLYTQDRDLPYENGDVIFPKEPESLPILSAYIILEITKHKDNIKIATSPAGEIEDISIKLKKLHQDIQASEAAQEEKDSLSAKIQELEKAVGTSKFETVYQEFIGLVLEYEPYFPAIIEFFKV